MGVNTSIHENILMTISHVNKPNSDSNMTDPVVVEEMVIAITNLRRPDEVAEKHFVKIMKQHASSYIY